VWNSNQIIEAFIGFGAKSVRLECSIDGAAWTELPGVPEFAQATGTPTYTHNTTVSLGGVVAQYVKLTINGPWGLASQTGLSEVRFFYVPVEARAPQPARRERTVDTSLDWRAGRELRQIYFARL
jgi:hypothetical protein